jgi:hypothetical protein
MLRATSELRSVAEHERLCKVGNKVMPRSRNPEFARTDDPLSVLVRRSGCWEEVAVCVRARCIESVSV